jgi:hypothetical protein
MSEMSCFTCGELEHFAKDCPKHADCKEKKVNLVTATMPMMGMVVFLSYFRCFNHLVGGLIQVLIFTCVLMSLYFLLTNCSKVLPF